MLKGIINTKNFSHIVALACLVTLILTPIAAVYFLTDINAFANLAQRNLALPIQWQSVTDTQWYGMWLLTGLYLSIGLCSLYFLRKAFVNFAKGEFFSQSNSRNLRLFSILLFIQAAAKPVHFALSSILLSYNHPPGQKMLSIAFGSHEIKVIVLAMILWVISDLLIKGGEIENENRQFV